MPHPNFNNGRIVYGEQYLGRNTALVMPHVLTNRPGTLSATLVTNVIANLVVVYHGGARGARRLR